MATRRSDIRTALQQVPRTVWISAALLLGLFTLALAIVGVEAFRAKAALASAAESAQLLQTQLSDGDTASARATLKDVRSDTERARVRTDGALWATAAHLPLFGDDVDAVRVATLSIDRIADEAMPPVVNIASSLTAKAFSPHNGQIDLARLSQVGPAVTASSRILDVEGAHLATIDPDRLTGALATPIRELQQKVGSARRSAHAAALASELGPALLGADKPRRYLLIFQNNAEIRSTGGLTGAFVILTADDGKLTIDQPGSNADLLGGIDDPVLPLTDEEKTVFPSVMGTDFRNTNFTPDFPRVAELDRAIVERKLGQTVSGVLSMDPVALSYVLRGTGPVTLDDGTVLTPENTVRVLLNEVYAKIPEPGLQDAYFAAATQRVFEKVSSGAGDPAETLRALAQGVSERRVMFWSADKSEQAKISGTAVANELPSSSKSAQVGVYLTDATLAKMQYYLDFKTSVESTQCSSNGVQTLVATTTLTSSAPTNSKNLPRYVTGNAGKVPDGSQLLIVRYYGTSGGAFSNLTLNGREQQLYTLKHHDRPVTYVLVKLKPGETATIVATSVTGRNKRDDGLFLTTPGLKPFRNGVRIRSACD